MSENEAIKILICQGTGGVSMGAKEVEAAFVKHLAEKGVNAVVGKRCDVIKTGCRGLCANDVLVDIITPEQGRDEPAEVWYLLGAWFLAAAFNASLTWWGVSVAIMKHSAEGGVLLGQTTMTKVVPIVVAVMVLAIRVLLINTFSVAGDRIFSMADERQTQYQNKPVYNKPAYNPNNDAYRNPTPSFPRPAPKPVAAAPARPAYNEPTYHPVGMSAQGQGQNSNRNNTYMS